MIVSAECRHCKITDTTQVDDGDYDRWMNREGLVQQVFPDLTASRRELLIAHRGGWYVCHRCWDTVFADDEEEDEVDRGPMPDGGHSEPSNMGGIVDA